MENFNEMILTVKEIMQLFECSEPTALTHMKAIRKQFNTKFVTKWHVADYLGIDFFAFQSSYLARIEKDFPNSAILIKFREALKEKHVTTIEAQEIYEKIVEEVSKQTSQN